jgi:DNA polymerase-3 subunit beta
VLIDGNYPDVARVIPQRSEHDAVRVRRADLLQAIKIARIFAKLNANIVRLWFSENELVIETNGKDVGSNRAVLECSATKVGKIAVNIDYLADAISTITDESITMYVTSENAPLTLCTDPTYQHIVMPMAVK